MISKETFNKFKKTYLDTPRAKQVQKFARRLVIAVIVGIIIYQLFDIGWDEVLRNLPTQPLFYILFFILYLTLPVAEVFIYRQVWAVQKWKMFKAFLTKRVYNDEVMGYSGELFLFIWARKYMSSADSEILKNIRDNNILSAVSSNTVTVLLLGFLVFTGVLDLEELIGNVDLLYIIAGSVIAAIVVALIVQFRKYIFELPLKKALLIFSIYFSRFIIHNGLMMVLWAVVIPEAPLSTWFIFVAIMIVVNRIPFLPSRDLVFLLAGIELSRMLDMTTAAVAGMLLVYSVLKKITNLIFFLVISYYSKDPEIIELKNKKDIAEQSVSTSLEED
ncbi:MAG: hypothetical protein EA390_13995 [Balneolaceae bacterium]|nr:MAG: hypothetical protein EA390_13995 [Balneolaceae bacterium]